MRTRAILLAAALAAAATAGCGGGEEAAPRGGTEPPDADTGGTGGVMPLPGPVPGMPMLPGHGALPPGHPTTAPASPFKSPEGWQSETPASKMRIAQFRLPRADGDAKDGEVAVFPGPMGTAEGNIDRWRGQFSEVVHGKDSLEEHTEGLKGKVTLLDVTGSYAAGAMGGMGGGGGTEAGTRMIAAILEIPGGPYYVKATGPEGTMAKWEESLRSFIMDAAKK